MDVAAIAGIIGTLSGVIVGAIATYQIQSKQITHENSTRFHMLRMETYTRFLDGCNKAAAMIAVKKVDFEAGFEVNTVFATVRLIASQKVLESAAEVYEAYGALQDDAIAEQPTDQAKVQTFNKATATFAIDAREELH